MGNQVTKEQILKDLTIELKLLGFDDFTEKTTLDDLGIDSLDVAECMVSIDKKYNIETDLFKLNMGKSTTVDDLSLFVFNEYERQRVENNG